MPEPETNTNNPDLDLHLPQDASIGPNTWLDKLNKYRFDFGAAIAPLLGIDYEEQANEAAHGIRKAMIPFTPGSVSKLRAQPANPGGYFIDNTGSFYQLGAHDTHESVLLKSGLMPAKRFYGYSETAQALHDADLIRIRDTPGVVGVELAKHPTRESTLALINKLADTPPGKQVVVDLWHPPVTGSQTAKDATSRAFKDPFDAIDFIYKFYGMR